MTQGERLARMRAKGGRQVSTMIRDPAALAVLDAETAKGRTIGDVLAWALMVAGAAEAGKGKA